MDVPKSLLGYLQRCLQIMTLVYDAWPPAQAGRQATKSSLNVTTTTSPRRNVLDISRTSHTGMGNMSISIYSWADLTNWMTDWLTWADESRRGRTLHARGVAAGCEFFQFHFSHLGTILTSHFSQGVCQRNEAKLLSSQQEGVAATHRQLRPAHLWLLIMVDTHSVCERFCLRVSTCMRMQSCHCEMQIHRFLTFFFCLFFAVNLPPN